MKANATDTLMQRNFLTPAGTETYLLFRQQFPLREFCAFEVFEHEGQLEALETEYLFPLLSTAQSGGHGLLLDALVWRAHPDFIDALGYPAADIGRINRLAVARTRAAVDKWQAQTGTNQAEFPVLVAADIGPRGDGYSINGSAPSIAAARAYHERQFEALAATDIDVVCALTMTSANEAIGVVEAAGRLDVPIIVSATVETDGRLPDGGTLADFVRRVDDATAARALYYMVNCAHPTHLEPTLRAAGDAGEDWLGRFSGFRANCSKKSHEELDNSSELDRGNPAELGRELADMQAAYGLRLLGGCCGTDLEHISEIVKAAEGRRGRMPASSATG